MTRITIYDDVDGAIPLTAEAKLEEDKLILKNRHLKIEISLDELMLILNEELHG